MIEYACTGLPHGKMFASYTDPVTARDAAAAYAWGLWEVSPSWLRDVARDGCHIITLVASKVRRVELDGGSWAEESEVLGTSRFTLRINPAWMTNFGARNFDRPFLLEEHAHEVP